MLDLIGAIACGLVVVLGLTGGLMRFFDYLAKGE
jgi:hypothetical protein